MTWLRCAGPCWCAEYPRVVASTGVPYTVTECAPDYRGVLMSKERLARSRWFVYQYGEARA